MDDLERRYARLVADMLAGVALERVADGADALAIEAPEVRLRVLAGALAAAARARAGGALEPEAIADAPVPAADTDAVIAGLDELLPGSGALAGRIASYRASTRIPPDQLRPAAERLLAVLGTRAREDLDVPGGESVSLDLVAAPDGEWRARARAEGQRTILALNASRPWEADSLVAVIAREAYPGRHLARVMRERPDPAAWEPSPLTTVERGRDAIGREVLLADHELAHELARIGRTAGLGWDGGVASRIGRAFEERRPVVARAAMDSSGRDVRSDLAAVGIDADLARECVARWQDPLARAAEVGRAAGPPLVRRWLETTGQTDGLRRLLAEPLTPTELRAESGDGC